MKWLLVQLFYAKIAIESSKESVKPCNKECWALLVSTISFEIYLGLSFYWYQKLFKFSFLLILVSVCSYHRYYPLQWLPNIFCFTFISGEITSQYLMNFSLRTQISLGMWTLASQVIQKYLCHSGFRFFNEGLYIK